MSCVRAGASLSGPANVRDSPKTGTRTDVIVLNMVIKCSSSLEELSPRFVSWVQFMKPEEFSRTKVLGACGMPD